MRIKKIISLLVISGAFALAACSTTPTYQEPQVYGMPQSQFYRLSPAQQQQVIQFHNQYVPAQTLTGQQVAEASSTDTVQKVVITHQGKKEHNRTTTVVSQTPSVGNPDLDPRNNPDLPGAVPQAQTVPVVVNTR